MHEDEIQIHQEIDVYVEEAQQQQQVDDEKEQRNDDDNEGFVNIDYHTDGDKIKLKSNVINNTDKQLNSGVEKTMSAGTKDWNVYPKLLYFLLFFAYGSTAYMSIFYQQLGLNPTEIGTVFALPPFISFISSPFWSGLADRTGKHVLILTSTCLVSTIVQCLLAFIEPGFAGVLFLIIVQSFFGTGVSPLLDSLVLEKFLTDKSEYGKQRLWGAVSVGLAGPIIGGLVAWSGTVKIMFLGVVLGTASFLIMLPIAIRHHTEDKEKRLFGVSSSPRGSISSWASSLRKSWEEALNKGQNGDERRNSVSSRRGLSMSELNLTEDLLPDTNARAKSGIKPKIPKSTTKETSKQSTESYITMVKTSLMNDKTVLLFLGSSFFYGISSAIISSFEYLFLSDYMGASALALGWLPPFTVVLELPFFFFASNLLQKWGTNKMLLISQLACFVRVMGYILLNITKAPIELVYIIDLLHGFGFSLFWAAAVAFMNSKMEGNMKSFGQGLLSGVFGGVGGGVGSIIGGVLYQTVGPDWMFAFVGVLVCVAVGLFPGIYVLVGMVRGGDDNSRKLGDEEEVVVESNNNRKKNQEIPKPILKSSRV